MAETTIEHRMTTTLDEIEERLPALPASVLRLERALAGRTVDLVAGAAGNVKGAVGAVSARTDRAARTVFGTARRAAADTLDTARVGARTTAGQTRAQANAVGERVNEETGDLRDAALESVHGAIRTLDPDDDASTGYERWTRDELYRKAIDLGIDGRSTMTKAELVAAIRAD